MNAFAFGAIAAMAFILMIKIQTSLDCIGGNASACSLVAARYTDVKP